jgi:DNA gyrase/topoisomerase IV subunit B
MATKDIQVLTDFEHILKRPTIYVGSVKLSEEVIPIVKSDRIDAMGYQISVGMYKLFDEVFSNSVDEAKRMKKNMESITVEVDSKTNTIKITDSGEGFTNGSSINKKSGLTNIATAVSMLRAGSNFDNENVSETLIGTNGMGVSLVNSMSSFFSIQTTNSKEYYYQEWENFKPKNPKILKRGKNKLGTSVSFTPLPNIFDNCKWNKDVLLSQLLLKKRVLETEDNTKDIKIDFIWDGKRIPIETSIFKQISYKTKIGELLIWEKTQDSGSFSFVNSAICTGIHQKIIADQINNTLEDSLAHHFYDFCLIINLPPALVKFGDQNKTKFVTRREDIENIIINSFTSSLKKFYNTPLFKKIRKEVEARKREASLKKIRKEKKNTRVKFSNKYFPPTSRNAENLFIVEGLSAMGSILQKRNPSRDGVYALKGKIKNARSLSDLADNKEILELMQILNLEPERPDLSCPYDNIVIATDQDPDGAHITSLLINLFFKWFPWIVENKKLSFLETPLVSSGDRSKTYYYSMEEFKTKSQGKKVSNVRYLKGLGSLSLDDWDHVMKNKKITKIVKDRKSNSMLEMAFGKSSDARKVWLSNFS